MAGIEEINLGASVSVIENEGSRVIIMRNETGEGIMTSYEILNGIYVLFSDFHMSCAESQLEHNMYMHEYRMSYAAKELLLSDLSIADIALLVGYTNPSKFSRAFKDVIGMLPKEYSKTRTND